MNSLTCITFGGDTSFLICIYAQQIFADAQIINILISVSYLSEHDEDVG